MVNKSKYETLPVYRTGDGTELDLLDLKVSLLHHGIDVDDKVYEAFEGKARLSKNIFRFSSMVLDEQISCFIALNKETTPFRLILKDGKPVITHNNNFLTEISFHEKTSFYEQKSSGGVSFDNLAMVQGRDALYIPCLWSCEFAKSGEPCVYCHSGHYAYPDHSLSEMMEAIRYAVEVSPGVKILKMTAGSTLNQENEIDRYVKILNAVDKTIGAEKLPSLIYLTPPSDLTQLDRLFDAGVRWICCNIDIWDEKLFNKLCPGKSRVITRQRYLDALYYIADKYGPNRAGCVFVAGIDPVESLVEGITTLAERGVVSWPSPLLRYVRVKRMINEMQPFSLDYFRTVRKETAKQIGRASCRERV